MAVTEPATGIDRIEANGLRLELAPRRMSGALVSGWQLRGLAPLVLQLPALALMLLLVAPALTTVWLAAGPRPLVVVCCAAVVCAAWTVRRLHENRWLPRAWDLVMWSLWLAGAVVAAIVAAVQLRWGPLACWTIAAGVGAALLWLWLRKSVGRLRTVLLPAVVGVTAVGILYGTSDGIESYTITVAWVLLTVLMLGLTILIAWTLRHTWWPWWPLIVPFGVSAFVAGLAGRLIIEWFADGVTSVPGQKLLYALMLGGAFTWVWFGALFVLVRVAIASIEADPVRSSDLAALTGWRRWWRLLALLNPVLVIVGLVVTVAAARVFDVILVGVPGPLQYTLDSVTLHWWYLPAASGGDRAAAAAFSLPLAVLVGLLAWLLQMGMPRHHTRWPTPPRAALPVHLRMSVDAIRYRGPASGPARRGLLTAVAIGGAAGALRILAATLTTIATVVRPSGHASCDPRLAGAALSSAAHTNAGSYVAEESAAREGGHSDVQLSVRVGGAVGESGTESSSGEASVARIGGGVVGIAGDGSAAADTGTGNAGHSGVWSRSAGDHSAEMGAGGEGGIESGSGEASVARKVSDEAGVGSFGGGVDVSSEGGTEDGRAASNVTGDGSGGSDGVRSEAGIAAYVGAAAGQERRVVANGAVGEGDWAVRVAIAREVGRRATRLSRRADGIGAQIDSLSGRMRRRVLPVGWQAGGLCLRVGLVSLVLLLPLAVLVVNSWRGLDGPALVGPGSVWRDGELWRALRNTALVAVVASVLTVTAALPPAYYAAAPEPASGRAASSARARSRAVMGLLVVLAVLPAQVYLGPIRSYITDHGLAGTSMPLILVHAAIGLPIAILILRGALLAPADSPLAETQRDPASVGYRVRGVARTAGPAVVAVLVLQLVQVWNDFFIGLQVRGADASPWSLLLWSEARQVHEGVAHLAAAGLLSSVPPVLLLLLTWRRFLVPGLTGGVLR
ncbi:ABC-type glycerol-3-phosphate transport system permease component [Nocardia sp. GP40]